MVLVILVSDHCGGHCTRGETFAPQCSCQPCPEDTERRVEFVLASSRVRAGVAIAVDKV